MAGGTDFHVKEIRDASDIYTVDGTGANEGKRAWFMLRRTLYKIQRDWRGVYVPNQLGAESSIIVFSLSNIVYTRSLSGSNKFICKLDQAVEKVNPTPYMLVIQEWEYLSTTPQRISAWFTPDEEA